MVLRFSFTITLKSLVLAKWKNTFFISFIIIFFSLFFFLPDRRHSYKENTLFFKKSTTGMRVNVFACLHSFAHQRKDVEEKNRN
jgi:hypothetical protein